MSQNSSNQGIVCPFLAAASNPAASTTAPGAPPPLVAGERNSLGLVYRHLRHNARMGRFQAVGGVLTALLASKGNG